MRVGGLRSKELRSCESRLSEKFDAAGPVNKGCSVLISAWLDWGGILLDTLRYCSKHAVVKDEVAIRTPRKVRRGTFPLLHIKSGLGALTWKNVDSSICQIPLFLKVNFGFVYKQFCVPPCQLFLASIILFSPLPAFRPRPSLLAVFLFST